MRIDRRTHGITHLKKHRYYYLNSNFRRRQWRKKTSDANQTEGVTRGREVCKKLEEMFGNNDEESKLL